MSTDPLDAVAAVADAVLFEGYLLYPYRASAQKNALRWQFGVLVPPATADALAEPSASRTECVVDPRAGATLRLRLRFLGLQRRTVVDVDGAEHDRLEVDGVPYTAWDEGVPRQVDAAVALDALADAPVTVDVTLPATRTEEEIRDATGTLRARVVRRSDAVTGRVVLATTPLPGPYGGLRLRVDVVNDTDVDPATPRGEALRTALISAHTVLGLDRGAFLSSADPPQWAAPAVAACVNARSWPVLAGPPGDGSLLLATPIILEDHPQLAPESPTNLFDGTENDEILALRTLALTDDEKREARATDPRAAHIVDAVDAMGPAMFERLHGAIRPDGRAPDEIPTLTTPGTPWWDPGADASVDPESDETFVDGHPVARGSSVILMPGRGSDAQDVFLRGSAATVQAVLHDVDGGTHVAVSIDDDPGADLQATHGRFRYFRPEELAVPL
ncbi:hypothetical protein ACQPX6_14265 [Actinomycetospora sp. CA-101289]|uniref:hypothetical protein n=1 Tax=Actinomycetospora sp. CA-101289 TaxID=3239893 RepID=UPI003D980028